MVYRAADGRQLTIANLEGLTSDIRYEIIGKVGVSAEAESLHEKARKASESRDYTRSISLLEKASSLSPAWPYPVYDMAFTYLLMKDAENARKYYAKTLELAPRGFFSAITALDTLEREAKGDLPEGTYLAYLSLEWLSDPAQRALFVNQFVRRVPAFAPGWKELAMQVESDAERLAAIEKGLVANPDGETKGILLINKALIMDRNGDHNGAIRLLGELALDPLSTYGTEHLAKVALANMTKK